MQRSVHCSHLGAKRQPAGMARRLGTVPNLRAMPAGCRFAPRCEFATERCMSEKPTLVPVGEGHFCRCFYPMDAAATLGGDRP